MAKEILLTRGLVAIVDDEDYEWVNQWKWYANKSSTNFYAVRSRTKTMPAVRMHRMIAKAPAPLEVDHINGNPLDNRKSNLRVISRLEHNRTHMPMRGIAKNSKQSTWRSQIHLGVFKERSDAIIAYRKAWAALAGLGFDVGPPFAGD